MLRACRIAHLPTFARWIHAARAASRSSVVAGRYLRNVSHDVGDMGGFARCFVLLEHGTLLLSYLGVNINQNLESKPGRFCYIGML